MILRKIISDETIPKGGVLEKVIQRNGYTVLFFTIRVTYDANATKGVRVRWLYSTDGVNYDSEEDAEAEGNYIDLSFASGATRQRTIVIPMFQNYVKIQIINLDGSYPVTINEAWILLQR